MRGLKLFLLINFIAGVFYTLLLLLFPAQLAGFMMAPEDMAWARYLVPIYLALSVASWHAYRKPGENIAVIQALLVMWAGLVLTHLLNAAMGDEQLSRTYLLTFFDVIMAAWLAYVYPWRKRETQQKEEAL